MPFLKSAVLRNAWDGRVERRRGHCPDAFATAESEVPLGGALSLSLREKTLLREPPPHFIL